MDRPGDFVEPTIIVDARNEWPCVQEETFAPLIYVMEYENLEDAINLHNGVAQGLASGIHSTHVGNIELFLSAAGSDCGIAKVNMGTTGADVGAAFGGEKETGGGSSGVGRKVANIVGRHLGRRALLECSGNNGCIVDETADLKLAAAAITFGAVGTSGQRCTSTRRVIAHRSIAAPLVELLKKAYGRVVVGDPVEDGILVGDRYCRFCSIALARCSRPASRRVGQQDRRVV
ncbi:hypothetical protein PSTG_18178 [Puccinia striiformis f. sp. tritici PST-78]|uniref:Aldehyde dehydrogenase domain-containing protein n=1 Tax=Puccinia striiformis f. sp. tritici PST-78 TaxID=1165861 RepID=A0A0L0UMZ1_9BASI|nr:hypothetical protein PSTG_18178 [Puccinia striiformis f. sp. tritici PST-78]